MSRVRPSVGPVSMAPRRSASHSRSGRFGAILGCAHYSESSESPQFVHFWLSRCVYIVSTFLFDAETGRPGRFRRVLEPCAATSAWGWTRASGRLPKAGGEVRARAERAWMDSAARPAQKRQGGPAMGGVPHEDGRRRRAGYRSEAQTSARPGQRSQPRANAIGRAPEGGQEKGSARQRRPFAVCDVW